MRVFLTGNVQKSWRERLAKALPDITFYKLEAADSHSDNAEAWIEISSSDIVVAMWVRSYSGIEMALELGYAYAKGIPIILIRDPGYTYMRIDYVVNKIVHSEDEAIDYLRSLL